MVSAVEMKAVISTTVAVDHYFARTIDLSEKYELVFLSVTA